mgnify:CR=1 FL=1
MARYDSLVTGGTLVIPHIGEVVADIAIRDGKVVKWIYTGSGEVVP